jgi:hypothetical protein
MDNACVKCRHAVTAPLLTSGFLSHNYVSAREPGQGGGDRRETTRRYNQPSSMALAVGTRLCPYEVVAPLGAVGMGEV